MNIIQVFDLNSVDQVNSDVQKISWNIMGSLLATSDSNNDIRLYKSCGNKWERIKSIVETQCEEENYL